VDLSGRDPTERRSRRNEKEYSDDSYLKPRERDDMRRFNSMETQPANDKAPETVDLSGRVPVVEVPVAKEDMHYRDGVESARRRAHSNSPKDFAHPPKQDSYASIDDNSRRNRREKLQDEDREIVASPTSFNAKDAIDIRSLREALKAQDSAPPSLPKEATKEERVPEPSSRRDSPRESERRTRREVVVEDTDRERGERSSRTDRPEKKERFKLSDAGDIALLRKELSQKEDKEKEKEPEPRKRDSDSDRDRRSRRDMNRRSSFSDSSERSQERTSGNKPRLVSPPREDSFTKRDDKPVKGILKPPKVWPEDKNPIREGVAPLKDAKKAGVPPDARWTKISRQLVNPEALERGNERYEAREEYVIVLRVLSKDEVQAYATETQRIRGMLPTLPSVC
jgi:hypothetical protein